MIENAGAEWNAVTREEYKKMKKDGKLAGMITRKITQHQGSERNTTYQESSASSKATAQRKRKVSL